MTILKTVRRSASVASRPSNNKFLSAEGENIAKFTIPPLAGEVRWGIKT